MTTREKQLQGEKQAMRQWTSIEHCIIQSMATRCEYVRGRTGKWATKDSIKYYNDNADKNKNRPVFSVDAWNNIENVSYLKTVLQLSEKLLNGEKPIITIETVADFEKV